MSEPEMTAPAAFEAAASAAPEDALILELDGFEGPLDLLLALARSQKVDLAKISILQLADQFLAFIESVRKHRLELAADYLVMAAWLAYLKSRLILPQAPAAEGGTAEDAAAQLRWRLQRLENMRESAARLMARERLDRDVISLSGVTTVIWLESINDYGFSKSSVEDVTAGVASGVARMRAGIPGVRILAGLLTSAFGAAIPSHGSAEVEAKRLAYNEFLKNCGLFDGVIDFATPTRDPETGGLRAHMKPGSSIGGPGDGLHPNRIGYLAMGGAVDLSLLGA